MAGEIRIGTSGWHYADWKGLVYPEGVPASRWLSHYVTWFPTVEINATFYRLARESAARGWHDTAPPGFEFAVKGSQYITHRKRLREVDDELDRFFAPLRPVLPVTRVVLWQLPPRWRRNAERLDRFLEILPAGPRHAVEFRDDAWFHPDIDEVLARHGASNVWLSSNLTQQHTFARTGDHLYVRFHGLGDEPYRYRYTPAELEPWAERLLAEAADGTPAWVYFNNDYDGHAIDNARMLIEMVGEAARPWPPVPTDDGALRAGGLDDPGQQRLEPPIDAAERATEAKADHDQPF